MNKNLLIVSLAVLLALAVGYIVGSDNSEKAVDRPVSSSETVLEPATTNSMKDVKTLVEFAVPDGWEEAECEVSKSTVSFRLSGQSEADCDNTPELSVKLSTIEQNITECNQIQDVQEVKKHICKSLFINDLRSLVAETEYLPSSFYGKDTFVKAYYLDSGNGIIEAQYISSSGGNTISGFEELVNSITAR